MNDHFDRHRDQLTDDEKSRVWKNLERHARGEELEPLRNDGRDEGSRSSESRPRWRSWWLAPIGAAAVATVLLVILLSDGPEPRMRIQAPAADTGELDLRRESKESPQALEEPRIADNSAGDLAAAPVRSREQDGSQSMPSKRAEKSKRENDLASESVSGSAAPGGRQATVPVPSPSAISRQAADSSEVLPASRIELLAGAAPGVISGRVVDSDSRPLAYATVVLVGTEHSAATDWNGKFAIRNVPEGEYDLQVLMMGYEPVTARSVKVSAEDGVLLAAVLGSPPANLASEVEAVASTDVLKTKRTDTSHMITSKDMASLPVDELTARIGPKAGVLAKDDEIHFRGGRAGEVQNQVDGVQVRDPLGKDAASPARPNETASNRSASATAPSEARHREASSLQSADSDAGKEELYATYGKVQSGVVNDKNAPTPAVPPTREMTPAPSAVPLTGGTALPNDEPFDAMYFESEGVNPFIDTRDDSQSTFAVDVDRASYTITREYLGRGYLPPRDAIRVEEFVNAFDPGYPEFTEPDFRIFVDGSPAPFRLNHQLVRVGIQGRSIASEHRKPTDLVFVVDVSGSMDREDRLQTVKRALGLLLDELHPSDRVAIVVYETQSRVVLRPTSVEDRAIIQSHIDALTPSGSTNAEEGLQIGYELAREMRREGRQTRLLLCSDGVANVGRTGPESILETVRRESDRGIYLSTIGFGMGNYNDVLMEQLADNGDGAAYYVDSIEEAERVFVNELSGTLQTIGRDAKIQVEFDPKIVERYRLLGYENRDVADRDFRNDAVDAGELGAGHTVTALYEVRLADDAPGNHRLGVVRFRWERPREDGGWSSGRGEVREIERGIEPADIAATVSRASAKLRMAAAAAELAEILRGSFWAKEHSIDGALELAKGAAGELRSEEARELVKVIERVKELQSQR